MDIYKEFFQELKYLIITLGIEKSKNVQGCTITEIEQLEKEHFTLPAAYKEYLQSVGRNYMWSFFDAEQFSYGDYDDIQEFASETFEKLNFKPHKKILPVAHRRYDYLRFIYEDDKEDPEMWFLLPYPHKNEENPYSSKLNFTDTLISYLKSSIHNQWAAFHFVYQEDEKKNPNLIRDRYIKWQKALIAVKAHVDNLQTENPYVNKLKNTFLQYYNANEDFIKQDIKKAWQEKQEKEKKEIELQEKQNRIVSKTTTKLPVEQKGFLQRLLNFWRS